ncbi:MAG: multicopper oxidase domain-containing protein, partial [Nannocystaceae bacterium]
GDTMIPLRRPTSAQIANARHRNFEFEKNPTDDAPWVIETDGGKGIGMDPRRVSAAPQLSCDPSQGPCDEGSGTLEIWRLVNGGNWSHPVHIHFEEGIILSRGNQPPPEHEKWARKDLYRIGPEADSGAVVEIALRFREFAGTFMEHCHNTQHEDHAMLLRWDIENPGQTLVMPTPMPTWDGVEYADTVALPTFRTGDGTGMGPDLKPMVIWSEGATVHDLDITQVGGLVDWTTGAVEAGGNEERGNIRIPLQQGVNDDSGAETTVHFFISEVSDEDLAGEFGVGYAGILDATPPPLASVGPATFDNGQWTFFGDLPNPIPAVGAPSQDPANTYTPLRRVQIDGQTVYFNIVFVSWGPDAWEHLRIDTGCTFPDSPANTNCRYQGKDLTDPDLSGQILAFDIGSDPSVTMKLHKAWFNQEYLPYYTVTDAWPCGPANGMGVPCVPKHEFIALGARPLIQFLPQTAFVNRAAPDDGVGFPPTQDADNVDGGGPLGGQVGLPSYFMPGPDYTPFWHIGFTAWNESHADMPLVSSYEDILALRAQGRVSIFEFPPTPARVTDPGMPPGGDYDVAHLMPAHVVNCPVPATLDVALLRATR